MPSLPDIPGKGLVAGTGRRAGHAGKVAVGAGVAMIAVGGYLAKRLLRRGGGGDGAEAGADTADPIAETPTAPPGAEAEAAEEKQPEAKATAEKAPESNADVPKAPEAKAPAPKAAAEKAPAPKADAPKPPESEADAEVELPPPAEEPHHALNNPVSDDPDPTEWPDPYEKRPDPRDPADPDGKPFGEEPHPATGAESTSEPPPGQDLEAGDRAEPPKRDKLDE